MSEICKKVILNNADDLPEDNGNYFAKYNDGHCADALEYKRGKSDNLWLHDVDWYLVDQSEEAQSKPLQANKEHIVQIPLWQMKRIEDTLRMANNIHHSQLKETCFDRCVCQSWDFAKQSLFDCVHPQQAKQPYSEPTEKQSKAEEIVDEWFHEYCEGRVEREEMIKQLEEYKLSGLPSDKEIEKAAYDTFGRLKLAPHLKEGFIEDFTEGAKAMRDGKINKLKA